MQRVSMERNVKAMWKWYIFLLPTTGTTVTKKTFSLFILSFSLRPPLIQLFCHHLSLLSPHRSHTCSFFSSLFSTSLNSQRPSIVGPHAAAEAAVQQRSCYVQSGGSHYQVCCQTGGHRGAGEGQASAERRQGQRGMRASGERGKSSQASSAFSV